MNVTQTILLTVPLVISKEAISPEQKIMNRLQLNIEKQFRHSHNAVHYSAQIRISSGDLNLLTLRYFGYSVSEMINRRLYIEAIIQLNFSNSRIQDISYYLGFASASCFITWFKKHTGLTPVEFRKMYMINLNCAALETIDLQYSRNHFKGILVTKMSKLYELYYLYMYSCMPIF